MASWFEAVTDFRFRWIDVIETILSIILSSILIWLHLTGNI